LLDPINKTKKKILLAAIDLYNEKGLFNVLNQEIAKASGISLSNFNYHFPTKKDLVLSVCGYMSHILNKRIEENNLLINDSIPLEIVKIYLEFEKEFKFFYLDTHNILRSYEILGKEMELQIHKAVQLIKNIIYVSVGKGDMIHGPGIIENTYEELSNQIWMTCHFWYAQSHFKNEKKNIIANGLQSCYGLLAPYLTSKGIIKYKEFLNNFN
jgi:hypothetical protein